MTVANENEAKRQITLRNADGVFSSSETFCSYFSYRYSYEADRTSNETLGYTLSTLRPAIQRNKRKKSF